jgi:hypothetical protein
MIDHKFPCEDLAHDLYKWGIEYATDSDGDEIVHIQWFTTEKERDQAIGRILISCTLAR